MQKERASKKQQELLSFVDGFIKGNGYGPSYREIMRALGYKSVSTVAIHIDNLIAKGYLARRDKSARSLEVVSLRSENEATVAQPAVDIEAMLISKADSAELTPEQRRSVADALRLLGYERAADVTAQEPTE
jgi:repressor LexA